MRAFIWAMILSLVFSSGTQAATSAECNYVTVLPLIGSAPPEDCSKGKVEDRLDCLSRLITAQKYEITRLRCEIEQMQEAKVRPLGTVGRAD